MRITSNLHFTGFHVGDYTRPTEGSRPFTVLTMAVDGSPASDVDLYLYDAADCDELIKAAAEAKRLLLAAQDTPAVLPRVHVHLFGQDGICTLCGTDIVTWSQAQGDAELDRIAIEGTLS